MLEPESPWEIYLALSQHHLPRMRPDFKEALFRRAWGEHLPSIALHIHVSERTVKDRLGRAQAEVFETLLIEVHADAQTASTWVSCHLDCCLADTVALLRAEASA